MSDKKDFSKRFDGPPEDREKDGVSERSVTTKIVSAGVGIVVLFALFLWIGNSISGGDRPPSSQINTNQVNQTPSYTTAAIPSQTAQTQSEKNVTEYKRGETAKAGKFDIVASGMQITKEIKSDFLTKTSENQFVVVTVKITNNDDRARDISSGMFELIDEKGRTYKAADITFDEFLFYDTINPGLSKSAKVAFETAEGLNKFKLKADSGVALAGGESVIIDLAD